MSTPTASAEIIPARRRAKLSGDRDSSHLNRIPTLDELPPSPPEQRRGEVVVYSGVSFGTKPTHAASATHHGGSAPRGPIDGLSFFTDPAQPGQIFARVMIMEPGNPVAREAVITPPVAVSRTEQQQLDPRDSLSDLVQRANMEASRFFDRFGPIDSELKMKAFHDYMQDQEDLDFLFTNLVDKNRDADMEMFSAYFAPGGATSGVGVFVNTWL